VGTAFWTTLKDAWTGRAAMGDKHLIQVERAFLPAALEILETPPSPTVRILAWSIVVLFTIALTWACLGHIDVVAVAEGKIIPSGRTKVIQPLEKAVVKAILVKEGQYVNQGDALIELDRTLTGADQAKYTKELAFINGTIKRQELFVKLLADPGRAVDVAGLQAALPTDKDQVQLLLQQWNSYRSRRDSLEAQLRENQAARRTSEEVIKQLEETLPLTTKRFQAYQRLKDEGAVSDFDYMDKQKEFIDQRQALAAERAHHEQLDAAVRTIEKEILALDAEARRQALAEIQDAQRQRQAMEQDLTKATDLNAKQVLYAPVAGEVQQLVVTTIGGVVTEAQPLMLIVPRGAKLEAEVNVENKDIGFVREGQVAEIKVHTFPFTRYGVIDAKVTGITRDAVEDEKLGLVYKMRLEMAKSSLWVDGKEVGLSPGMAVSAEVKTGKRRLIEYFLSPLIQHVDESVRER